MKAYSIIRTDRFRDDIQSIILGIAQKFDYKTANEIIDLFSKEITRISKFPEICPLVKHRTLRKLGYRVLNVKKTIIIYRVDKKSKTIILALAVDERKDYNSVLSEI